MDIFYQWYVPWGGRKYEVIVVVFDYLRNLQHGDAFVKTKITKGTDCVCSICTGSRSIAAPEKMSVQARISDRGSVIDFSGISAAIDVFLAYNDFWFYAGGKTGRADSTTAGIGYDSGILEKHTSE